MRNVLNIEASKIVVPEGRMRPVRDAQVEELRDSIGKGRLLQPLVVGVPNADKPWPLVDGAHRLAALKKLKCRLVPCFSIRGTKDELRLSEIEANLARSPLTVVEISEHLVEQKRLREVLYPETKGGVSGARARWMQTAKLAVCIPEDSFGEKMGMAPRAPAAATCVCASFSRRRNALASRKRRWIAATKICVPSPTSATSSRGRR